jgi:hypothetical protein
MASIQVSWKLGIPCPDYTLPTSTDQTISYEAGNFWNALYIHHEYRREYILFVEVEDLLELEATKHFYMRT